jgi:ATP-dependent DNA helicase RecG
METYIDKILRKGEGRRVEFKAAMPEKSQIAKTVIAFANGVGGELFIGIDEKNKIVTGVADADIFKLEEQISHIVYDNCNPVIIPDINVYSYNDKNIICVKVYPSKNGPYYLKSKGKFKGTIIRVGSTNRIADETILSELERRNRNVSFDSLIVYDLTPNNCDLGDFIKFYHDKCGKTIEKEQLKTLNLIKIEQDEEYLTNAALLLASNHVKKQTFPYAKIECARFKGNTTSVMIDQQTIDGPVFAQPEEAMKFIMRNISQSSTIDLVYRNDRWEYPLKAIREVVINAVIHRDYSIYGSDIKIAIFDDMLEITSPGTLMPSASPESLENTPSEIRNRVIAPIFKECRLIEQWGSGFQKVYAELAEYPDILLKINEPSLSFQIQFIKKDYQFAGDVSSQDNGGLNIESGEINFQNGGIKTRNGGLNVDNGGINAENGGLNVDSGGINIKIDALNGEINGGLNEELKLLVNVIKENPGKKTIQIAIVIGKPVKTIEKQIKKLIDKKFIEHRGSNKTGGYWVVESEKTND